jgi:Protein of unknown function (DUF3606)
MNGRRKRDQTDRSKINLHHPHEVKHWARALGATKEDLRKAIEKVGNSAVAVRKELRFLETAPRAKERPEMPISVPTVLGAPIALSSEVETGSREGNASKARF